MNVALGLTASDVCVSQVMGGKDSASFSYFRELCVQAFLEARKPENCQVPPPTLSPQPL